jgi:hypothetical protein
MVIYPGGRLKVILVLEPASMKIPRRMAGMPIVGPKKKPSGSIGRQNVTMIIMPHKMSPAIDARIAQGISMTISDSVSLQFRWWRTTGRSAPHLAEANGSPGFSCPQRRQVSNLTTPSGRPAGRAFEKRKRESTQSISSLREKSISPRFQKGRLHSADRQAGHDSLEACLRATPRCISPPGARGRGAPRSGRRTPPSRTPRCAPPPAWARRGRR